MPTQNTVQWDILALYDAVMAEVEPDLTRANLSTLADKYKDEAPEQQNARAERYTKAYAEWQRRLKKIVSLWKKDVMVYRNQLLKDAKIQSVADDEKAMNDIASTIEHL